MKSGLVCQFRITLLGIAPAIWRRIQVPESYSFWDLHVAIQDAIGWLDYHLHAFRFEAKQGRRVVMIGIPDEEFEEDSFIPSWTVPIADQFIRPGMTAVYEYDFGDGWEHEVLLEGILVREPKAKYPRCLDGERACPSEDCGGIPGYQELLKVLRNPRHREYADTIAWLKGHARNYHPYDPANFDPKGVRFMNPRKRFKMAFSGKG